MDYVQYKRICCAIESALKSGKKEFIIYPYGMNGMFCKIILNERYGIDEWYIVDNNLCKFRKNVKKLLKYHKLISLKWQSFLLSKIQKFTQNYGRK